MYIRQPGRLIFPTPALSDVATTVMHQLLSDKIFCDTVEWTKSEWVIHFDIKIKLVLDVFLRFFLQRKKKF